MLVMTHKTGRILRGKDKDGNGISRTVYADRDGNEYVRLGRFSTDGNALVGIDYFISHLMNGGNK